MYFSGVLLCFLTISGLEKAGIDCDNHRACAHQDCPHCGSGWSVILCSDSGALNHHPDVPAVVMFCFITFVWCRMMHTVIHYCYSIPWINREFIRFGYIGKEYPIMINISDEASIATYSDS